MEGVGKVRLNLQVRSSDLGLVTLVIAFLLILSSFFYLAKVYANPDTETLRPSGVGTTTQCTPYGATYNWDCVDEATADEDTTYVLHYDQSTGGSSKYDTYAIQDHSLGSGTINSVTIYQM